MQEAEKIVSIHGGEYAPGIFNRMIGPDGCKLDDVNARLRHLNTVIGMLIYCPDINDDGKDVLALIHESLDACIAITENLEAA